ncbi:major facilitator superfamily domain-containing protein [Aspergillus filifer]
MDDPEKDGDRDPEKGVSLKHKHSGSIPSIEESFELTEAALHKIERPSLDDSSLDLAFPPAFAVGEDRTDSPCHLISKPEPELKHETERGTEKNDLEKAPSAKREPQTGDVDSEAAEPLTPEDESHYLTGWRLIAMSLAPCLTMFAVCLDNTIVSTAIPTITDDFNTMADMGWYGAAYLMTAASTQILYGKIFRMYSAKWVSLVALLLFEIGSLICALAKNPPMLVIGRALAGLGAAGLLAGAVLVAGSVVPLRRRPLLVGIVSAINGLASIAGPLLGGVFTEYLSWRWCFYINLPIGGVAAVILLILYNPPKTHARGGDNLIDQLKTLDLGGTVIFMGAVISIVLAVQWGNSRWPWSDAHIIGLLVACGVLAIIYTGIQWYLGEQATLPGRLVRNRSVAFCALSLACISGAYYSVLYYLPIWFQVVNSTSAVGSGIRTLPTLGAMIVFSIAGGALVSWMGRYTPLLTIGAALIAIGSGLLSTLSVDTGPGPWAGYQILLGAGLGLAVQQPIIAMQASLSTADVPLGTAIMFFSQTLGGSLFLTGAQNLFGEHLQSGVNALDIDGVTASLVQATGTTSLRSIVPAAQWVQFQGVYNAAVVQTFYLAAGVASAATVISLAVPWGSVKGVSFVAGG